MVSSAPLTSAIDDVGIRALVMRLARPCAGGGHVIERAAIRAAGSDSAVIEGWILDHAGRLESTASTSGGGLHRARSDGAGAPSRVPRRFLLPPGALDAIERSPTTTQGT